MSCGLEILNRHGSHFAPCLCFLMSVTAIRFARMPIPIQKSPHLPMNTGNLAGNSLSSASPKTRVLENSLDSDQCLQGFHFWKAVEIRVGAARMFARRSANIFGKTRKWRLESRRGRNIRRQILEQHIQIQPLCRLTADTNYLWVLPITVAGVCYGGELSLALLPNEWVIVREKWV